MKFSPLSVVGVLMMLLSGCGGKPKENYQQAYEQSLADGTVTMTTLRALDIGDIRKTRQVAMTSVHMTLSSLSTLAAQAHPTPQQKLEELTLARDVLDCMLAHRDEFDPRLPSVRVGVRSLQKCLTEPEDARRLKELSDYLAGVEKQMSETPRP
jgi:hypothetical protein